MNYEYMRLAYERTVLAALRRHAMDRYLEGGGGDREALVCEQLPYESREVPNEIVADVIQRLEEEERAITNEMSKFDFRRRDRFFARPERGEGGGEGPVGHGDGDRTDPPEEAGGGP